MKDISVLKDKFRGATAALVATGPSLLNLTVKDMEKQDLILTLNFAILKVRTLQTCGALFTMQKDIHCVRPKEPEMLLVHRHESLGAFPDYPRQYLFNNEEFGFPWWRPSVVSALCILRLMGVARVRMIAFDALTTGDCHSTYDGLTVTHHFQEYKNQVDITRLALRECGYEKSVEWVTP